jgi:hypothetical protein
MKNDLSIQQSQEASVNYCICKPLTIKQKDKLGTTMPKFKMEDVFYYRRSAIHCICSDKVRSNRIS